MIQKLMKYNKLCMLLILLSCSTQKEVEEGNYVSLMVDTTDSITLVPTNKSIRYLLNSETNLDQDMTFRYQQIGSLLHTEIVTKCIPRGSDETNDDNPLFRQQRVYTLFAIVDSILHDIQIKKNTAFPTTLCFEKVCNELVYLSHIPNAHKTIIICSDLIENNDDVYKGYSRNEAKRILSDKKKGSALLEKILEGKGLLPQSLWGITVYLMYSPSNTINDRRFSVWSTAYQSILSKRGATVFITSSSNIIKENHEK